MANTTGTPANSAGLLNDHNMFVMVFFASEFRSENSRHRAVSADLEKKSGMAYHRITWTLLAFCRKCLEISGAGEGNRTLVIVTKTIFLGAQ